jgi:hypothetical protein
MVIATTPTAHSFDMTNVELVAIEEKHILADGANNLNNKRRI